MNPDYLNTTLCELAAKFPVGARVVIRAGTPLRWGSARRDLTGTVVDARERDVVQLTPSRARVGGAFTSARDGRAHIAVRWDDNDLAHNLPSGIGSAFPRTLELRADPAPAEPTFTQADLDAARADGVAEGRRLAAREFRREVRRFAEGL